MTKAALALCAVSLVAAAPSLAVAQDPAAPLPLSPFYAPLFHDGATMAFAVVQETTMWDDQDPAADEHGLVRNTTSGQTTCTVRLVFHTAEAASSAITCDGDGGIIEGYWAADARGLWQLSAEAGDVAGIAAARFSQAPLLDAVPSPILEASETEEFGMRRTVEQDGPGWCQRRETWGGDESTTAICFREGLGVWSMIHAWSGGSDMTTEWTRLEGEAPAPTSQPTSPE